MENKIKEFIKNCQVIVIAGGQGSRLAHITGELPKALININNKTLLEYCLEPFKEEGFQDFVFLLGKGGEKIQNFVNQKSLAPNAKFFIESQRLGKGGAMKNALKMGLIDKERPCLIVFPDDLFLKRNPHQFVAEHLAGKEKGCISSVIVTDKMKCDYGVVKKSESNFVFYFEEKPYLNVSLNTGMFIFEPEAYSYFENLIDMEKIPVEYEEVVAPVLAEKNLLYSIEIPAENWIPVNDEKGLKKARNSLN